MIDTQHGSGFVLRDPGVTAQDRDSGVTAQDRDSGVAAQDRVRSPPL